jgi:hypothetical protein
MRTFHIRPGDPEHDGHHMWMLIAVDDDDAVAVVGTYPTMAEAEAAKMALERGDVDIRS